VRIVELLLERGKKIIEQHRGLLLGRVGELE
jgi:hypothetical protein